MQGILTYRFYIAILIKKKKIYPPPGKMLKVSYYYKKKSNGSKLIYTHKVQLIRVFFLSFFLFFLHGKIQRDWINIHSVSQSIAYKNFLFFKSFNNISARFIACTVRIYTHICQIIEVLLHSVTLSYRLSAELNYHPRYVPLE